MYHIDILQLYLLSILKLRDSQQRQAPQREADHRDSVPTESWGACKKQVRATEISNDVEESKNLLYWAITATPVPCAETVMRLIQYLYNEQRRSKKWFPLKVGRKTGNL